VPQSGTSTKLDALADRLMYRLAYRNFGDHESLVAAHSVTAGSSVGVRWYEIRNPGGTPTVYQQGTYAPDSLFRWMGSVAMNKSGDIALGYSVSSSSMFPGIRYTGRLTGDPLGQMTQSEGTLFAGTGSQTGGWTRWGDYTSMSVDPSDDCTFWYTNQYLQQNGAFNWSTRVGSFKFASCTTGPPVPDFGISGTPATRTVLPGGATFYTVTVSPSNGFNSDVALSNSAVPADISVSFDPASIIGGSGTSSVGVTTSSLIAPNTYNFTVTGTGGGQTHTTAQFSLVVSAPQVGDFSLSAAPGTRNVRAGNSTTYTVTIARVNGFSDALTLSASGLPAGANASFSPQPAGGTSSVMTVTTSNSTPNGSSTVTITGTGGGKTHSTSVTLQIR
jgi:hypothetical protein